MNTKQSTPEQIAEAHETIGTIDDVGETLTLNYHGVQALRVLLAATAQADEAAAYTADELDFIDKAMLEALGLVSAEVIKRQPSGVASVASQIAMAALEERRKIRGPAMVLDENGAKRLERLDAFYAGAFRVALGAAFTDPDATLTSLILQRLHEQKQTMQGQTSQISSLTTKVNELQRLPRTTLLQQANLRVYERTVDAMDKAQLPMFEGKDTVECVDAMIARIRTLEEDNAKKDARVRRAATLIENMAEFVDDAEFARQAKDQAVQLRAFIDPPTDATPEPALEQKDPQ